MFGKIYTSTCYRTEEKKTDITLWRNSPNIHLQTKYTYYWTDIIITPVLKNTHQKLHKNIMYMICFSFTGHDLHYYNGSGDMSWTFSMLILLYRVTAWLSAPCYQKI
jgi:hypothetical protein